MTGTLPSHAAVATAHLMAPRQRSLSAYLVVPRPKDLVKGLLIPTTYLLGVLSVGEVSSYSVLRACVVVTAVEFLVYPARYQWNDIRGFAADQQHPSSKDRGRLPGPLHRAREHVVASAAVMAARLAVTGLLVLLWPGLAVLGWATVAVFGVAIVYEVLRSLGTGHTGEIPAPLSAGVVLLWLWAGAGYAVRGLIGLALAVDLSGRPTLVAAAAVTLWAYGIAFVTARWALEATAFASSRGGVVVWQARAGQAREHLLALVRWLPGRIVPPVDVKDWAPLRDSTSITAPWHLAVLTAGGAASLTGRLLCGPCTVGQGAAAAVVGVVATTVVAALAHWRPYLMVLGAVAVVATMMVTHGSRPGVGVVPWLLLMGAYWFFTTRTMRRLARPNVLGVGAGVLGRAVARTVLGGATWEAVSRRSGAEAAMGSV